MMPYESNTMYPMMGKRADDAMDDDGAGDDGDRTYHKSSIDLEAKDANAVSPTWVLVATTINALMMMVEASYLVLAPRHAAQF